MVLYAAILETVDHQKDSDLLEVHKAYLQELIEKGHIFAKGPFTDHSGGLVIYQANSLQEAMNMASEDPAVLHGSRKLILKEWRSNLG